MNLAAHSVTVAGRPINLTGQEKPALRQAGRLFTYSYLYLRQILPAAGHNGRPPRPQLPVPPPLRPDPTALPGRTAVQPRQPGFSTETKTRDQIHLYRIRPKKGRPVYVQDDQEPDKHS